MSNRSLGLIETKGLTAGIEAADAALKSANVSLVGYEVKKMGGLVTIKVEGDVGAVQAAIQAAGTAAGRLTDYFSAHVIPRPSKELEKLVRTPDTVGHSPVKPAMKTQPSTKPAKQEEARPPEEPVKKEEARPPEEPVKQEEARPPEEPVKKEKPSRRRNRLRKKKPGRRRDRLERRSRAPESR